MAKCSTNKCKKGAVVRHRDTMKDGTVKSQPFCSVCSAQQIFDPSAGYKTEVINIASKKVMNTCLPNL